MMPAAADPRQRSRVPIAPLAWRLTPAALLLAACTVGPNYKPPTPQVPPHWSSQALDSAPRASSVTEQDEPASQWWREFHDATLDSLIERAQSVNLDVRLALLRIDEARVQRAIARAGYLPTVALDASYTRQRFSETTPTGSLFNSVGSIHLPGGESVSIPNPYNQFQLSGGIAWEIDLFGRVRRSVEAAQANLQVSAEDHRAVILALLSDVSEGYLELRGAQERLRVARENLDTIQELLELTRNRRDAGLVTQIDVSNAAAQAEVTRAEIPALEMQITQSVNLLSRLLDREPEALRAELGAPMTLPAVPDTVAIGVPSALARRRPDIREAEANLHAATAQIGVAVASLFPSLTLAATGGDQSETLGHLFEWASRFGSVGPTFDLPVLDVGRWKTVRLYDVRAQEAALSYRRAVLAALHEVENALAAYSADQQRRLALEAAVAQNRDALALSRQRYEKGLTSFIDVLDADRSLQQNDLALAAARVAVSTDLVEIFRALGGGVP